jgi:heat-inducible transcriptional repressor
LKITAELPKAAELVGDSVAAADAVLATVRDVHWHSSAQSASFAGGATSCEEVAVSLDDRKLEVLKAIVEDFVSTNEPVGSKALTERHALGVSSATIRNDMAALEEEGYIAQPHTSAGRVPTEKGYRLFVDRLSAVKPLSSAERRAIHSFLAGAFDLDEVLRRTVRLLAQLTRQVAVVQYPSLVVSQVRHLEVVQVDDVRVMLVLITDTGRVEQRVVEAGAMSEEQVTRLRAALNSALRERRLSEAPDIVADLPDSMPPDLRLITARMSSVLLELLADPSEERIVLGGTANLDALDFPHSIRPVLEALEEQVVLLKLFGEVRSPSAVRVRIGQENADEVLRSTSIVAAGYGSGETLFGGLGVLGPTRMDYIGTISAVHAVARYVGELLASG